MPMPSEHLATAEALAEQARLWLVDGQLELASAYRDMAALHLNLAQGRYAVIGDSLPPAQSAQPLPPEWCGKCEGPDLNMRFLPVEAQNGRETFRHCPDCHPRAWQGREVPQQSGRGEPVQNEESHKAEKASSTDLGQADTPSDVGDDGVGAEATTPA